MAVLDTISIGILLGALLVLAGIMSSLVALRFGAPLLLVFLIVGMLAGEGGPGGIQFDDVRTTYVVGSIALALILFDGGLRTRFAIFRSVLAPAVTLATVGVLVTAALTAPVAKYLLAMSWTEALLVGAVVASTDAAAVFFLLHARGLRLRPRVGAILEVESGSNDPFAVLLTLLLVEFLTVGDRSWQHVLAVLAEQAVLGTVIGVIGGRAIVVVLNRLGLAQGLHAPFVTTSALVIFGLASAAHGSGFLAAYLAGLVVGNRPTRAHNTVIVFLDAATWLAQIVMFVLLGLLVWLPRQEHMPRRVELDLPGQLAQEIVGYPVAANSPYLRRGLLPSWARPTLVVREERILGPAEAEPVRQGDYVYLLAPPEKAQALDRFFIRMPAPAMPDPHLLGDFFVTGDHTLGELAEIYGLMVAPEETATTLADYFATELKHPAKQGEVLQLGPIALVAYTVVDGQVTSVGLRLPEEEVPAPTLWGRLKTIARRLVARLG